MRHKTQPHLSEGIDDGFRILGVPQAGLQHAHPTMKRAAFNKRGGFLNDFVAHEYASFDL